MAKNLKLVSQTLRSDGKIEEVWQPAAKVHHWIYAAGCLLALVIFWPLAIALAIAWAETASYAHDKYYVIKDSPKPISTS